MSGILNIVQILAGIGSLVCFIMVVMKMFQNGKKGAGIASILTYCCLIGNIIALVVGWQNADRWNIRQLMMIYSILFGVSLVVTGITYPEQMRQFQVQMDQMKVQQGAQPGIPAPKVAP